MSKLNDGGPAFPVVETHPVHGSRIDFGMTLRDWFAGQALAMTCEEHIEGGLYKAASIEAHAYADAMLNERELTRCSDCGRDLSEVGGGTCDTCR